MGAQSSSLQWCEQMMVAGYEKDIDTWATLYTTYKQTLPEPEENGADKKEVPFPVNVTYHVDWAWKHIHHVSLTLFPDGTFKRVVKKEPYVAGAIGGGGGEASSENAAGAFDETNLQYIEPAVYAGLFKYERRAGKKQQDHITLAEAPVVYVDGGVQFLPNKLTYRSVAVTAEGRYIPDDAQGLGFIFGTPGPLRTTADAPPSAATPFHVAINELTPASPTKAEELENSDGDSFVVELMKMKQHVPVVVEEAKDEEEEQKE